MYSNADKAKEICNSLTEMVIGSTKDYTEKILHFEAAVRRMSTEEIVEIIENRYNPNALPEVERNYYYDYGISKTTNNLIQKLRENICEVAKAELVRRTHTSKSLCCDFSIRFEEVKQELLNGHGYRENLRILDDKYSYPSSVKLKAIYASSKCKSYGMPNLGIEICEMFPSLKKEMCELYPSVAKSFEKNKKIGANNLEKEYAEKIVSVIKKLIEIKSFYLFHKYEYIDDGYYALRSNEVDKYVDSIIFEENEKQILKVLGQKNIGNIYYDHSGYIHDVSTVSKCPKCNQRIHLCYLRGKWYWSHDVYSMCARNDYSFALTPEELNIYGLAQISGFSKYRYDKYPFRYKSDLRISQKIKESDNSLVENLSVKDWLEWCEEEQQQELKNACNKINNNTSSRRFRFEESTIPTIF